MAAAKNPHVVDDVGDRARPTPDADVDAADDADVPDVVASAEGAKPSPDAGARSQKAAAEDAGHVDEVGDDDEEGEDAAEDAVAVPEILFWDEPIQWKPSVAVGLANLGNTCYLNSILEALVHCSPIVAFFCHKWPDAGALLYCRKPNRTEFVNHFADMVRRMWAEGRDNEEQRLKKFLTPRELVRGVIRAVPEFRENGQQDAQEALNYIMNDLHEELAVQIDASYHPARDVLQVLDHEQKAWKRSHRRNTSRQADGGASIAAASSSGRRRKFKPSFRRRSRARAESNSLNGGGSRASGAGGSALSSPAGESASSGPATSELDLDEDEDESASGVSSPRDPSLDVDADRPTFRQLESPYAQSIISDTFQTLLVQRVTCKQCGYTSMSLEEYLELSLALPSKALMKDLRRREEAEEMEVPSRHRSVSTSSRNSNTSSNGGLWGVVKTLKSMVGYETQMLTLRECMQAFFAPEHLTGDEQYYCEKCCAKQDAEKSHSFAYLPEVLCLNLKRFNRTTIAWTLNSTKNQTPVMYPVNDLDLSEFYFNKYGRAPSGTPPSAGSGGGPAGAEGGRENGARAGPRDASECMYDLVAVVRHSGGMNGGHYTSLCKNPVNHKWYEYDDDQVREIPESSVQSTEAYLLFYRKHRSAGSRESFKELQQALARSAEADLDVDDSRFISQYWTLKWATLGRPGVCGTFDSTCPHGRLLPLAGPSADARVFRVTPEVHATIDRLYGAGEPTLQEARECEECSEARLTLMERREEEKRKIRELDGVGPASYILCNTWAKSWQRFVRNAPQTGRGTSDGVPPPGPICNATLLQAGGADVSLASREPRPNLRRDVHYIIINRGIWEYLVSQYGGGPTLVSTAQLIYDLDREPFMEAPENGEENGEENAEGADAKGGAAPP